VAGLLNNSVTRTQLPNQRCSLRLVRMASVGRKYKPLIARDPLGQRKSPRETGLRRFLVDAQR
jgi:hypothetical protein